MIAMNPSSPQKRRKNKALIGSGIALVFVLICVELINLLDWDHEEGMPPPPAPSSLPSPINRGKELELRASLEKAIQTDAPPQEIISLEASLSELTTLNEERQAFLERIATWLDHEDEAVASEAVAALVRIAPRSPNVLQLLRSRIELCLFSLCPTSSLAVVAPALEHFAKNPDLLPSWFSDILPHLLVSPQLHLRLATAKALVQVCHPDLHSLFSLVIQKERNTEMRTVLRAGLDKNCSN